MFGDAIKRLEYAIRQRPEPLFDASGEPTAAYWTLYDTIEVMFYAIGEDALLDKLRLRLERGMMDLMDLFAWLREHGIGNTPYDKLIPWTYRVFRESLNNREFLDVRYRLPRMAAAIMQWQAATRTDINKLSVNQVLAAVDAWDAAVKPAKNVGEIIYRFRDGWTVQRLDEPAALKEEGKLLHHCVGSYCEEVAAGTSVIFSLRDPANVPRITMEWDPIEKRFVQIHGDKNAAPTPDVQPYLVEVIQRVFGSELRGLRMTGAPLKELDLRGAVGHHVDLSNMDLSGAHLTGADLRYAKLRRAVLAGADLPNAILTNAKLDHAVLYNADLTGANLTFAVLSGAKLPGAVLRYAKLRRAVLAGADLSDVDMTGADLTGANLTDAIFNEDTIMPNGTYWSPPAGLGHHRRRRF